MTRASLVVNIRLLTSPWRSSEYTLEPGLVSLGESGLGHVLVVLQTIPGSLDHELALDVPLALLVSPSGDKLAEGGVSVSETMRCSRQIRRGEAHESADAILERWWHANRERWDLTTGPRDALWREVAFLRGYHAATHAGRRVQLALRASQRAARAKLDHARAVERLLGAP